MKNLIEIGGSFKPCYGVLGLLQAMLWSVRATLIAMLEKISVKSMLDLSLCETIGVKVN